MMFSDHYVVCIPNLRQAYVTSRLCYGIVIDLELVSRGWLKKEHYVLHIEDTITYTAKQRTSS